MWNPLQVTEPNKFPLVLLILTLVLLMFFSYQVGIKMRTNNYLAKKDQMTTQIAEISGLSQDEAISIVRNLPEVKNFFETSPERHTETSRYKPMIVVEWEKDDYWQVWVYEWVYDSEKYDDYIGVSHTATFNRYIVDRTGKIKCSFAIYEDTKLIRVTSEKEYPCI